MKHFKVRAVFLPTHEETKKPPLGYRQSNVVFSASLLLPSLTFPLVFSLFLSFSSCLFIYFTFINIKAANLLKNSEGLLSIVVAKTPKTCLRETGQQISQSIGTGCTGDSVTGSLPSARILSSDHRKYSSTDQPCSGASLGSNNNNDNGTLNKNQSQFNIEETSSSLDVTTINDCKITSNGNSKLKTTSIPSESNTSCSFVTLHSNDKRNIGTSVSQVTCDPRTCAIVPGGETVIEITKGHNALGISVAGGIDTPLVSIIYFQSRETMFLAASCIINYVPVGLDTVY